MLFQHCNDVKNKGVIFMASNAYFALVTYRALQGFQDGRRVLPKIDDDKKMSRSKDVGDTLNLRSLL
jgi:hypothetical protein